MRDDLTAIYYTCNRENPEFEKRIQRNLLETMEGLPLISVSQKPIDFGKNICVGEVGASSQNAFRQLQIGAIEAKTRFVCPVEADFLYPKEYFEFKPDRINVIYIASPLYVLFAMRGKGRVFCLKPRGSEAAMMVGRDFLIKRIEDMLHDWGRWGNAQSDGNSFPYLFFLQRRRRFFTKVPIVTFKTDGNMHRKTPYATASKTRELPFLGTSTDLIRKYLG